MSRAQRMVYHFCRLSLGGIFIYAGYLKAQDVDAFAGAVAGYQLFPYAINYLIAATLPWIELLAGGLLLANRHVRASTLLLTGLTGLFILVLFSAVVRGLEVDCGCFAASAQTDPWVAILRDVVILALAHMVFHLRSLPEESSA